MAEYLVSWSITVDNESPEAAVNEAFAVLQDQLHHNNDCFPPVFIVTDKDGNKTSYEMEV